METKKKIAKLLANEQVIVIMPVPEDDKESEKSDIENKYDQYGPRKSRLENQSNVFGNFKRSKFAGSHVSTLTDSMVAVRLINDMGLNQVYYKTINGQNYAIFKGSPDARKIFTGSRYLESNPKLVRMAIGRQGLKGLVTKSALVTFVIFASIDIFFKVATDQFTMGRLLGTLSTDVVKIFMSCSIGYGMGVLVGAITTVVAAPVVATILITLLASYTLDILDNRYGITEKLVALLEEMGRKGSKSWGEISRRIFSSIAEIENWLQESIAQKCLNNPWN